jgi:polar amino acid transport system substrate-binding protein
MFTPIKRLRPVLLLVALFAVLGTLPSSASAQNAPVTGKTMKVAIKPLEPFVAKRGDGYAGFSIDLWEEVARRNGWTTEYVWSETVGEVLKQVQESKVDVGIAGISMTKEREAVLDFSYPMFNSGLQVMVGASQKATWKDSVRRILSPTLFKLLATIIVLFFVAGNFIWLFNRHREDYPKGYVRGVGEGMWWAGSTVLANEANGRDPSRAWSRLVAMVWILTGIIFVANFTATISSQLTVQSIQGQINGVDDLPGKRIATVTGTTAEKELQVRGIPVAESVTKIDDAYQMLDAKEIDAIVYDAPVLLYRASHAGKGRQRVVGPIFRPEPYGIAVPNDSPLREQINATLLSMNSDGTYSTLYSRYFSVT